jgi:hypothetical protein
VPVTNQNLWIWTTDWHLVNNFADHGIVGEVYPVDGSSVSDYIIGLRPAGVIDTGDCKDHYGANTYDAHGHYRASARDELPWGVVTAPSALYPILPGNHDEIYDYTDTRGTDFSLFDQRFWAAPYHWICDWAAARIRFIGFHSNIVHAPDIRLGFFSVAQTEIDYVTDQLAALPANYTAIVCCHPPIAPTFGEYIYDANGGTALRAVLSANAAKITCCIGGHRHFNFSTTTLDGIPHFSGPAMSYTLGNSLGGWVPITLDPAARTLTWDYLLGPPSSYTRYSPGGVPFTPIVLTLPA